MNEENFDMYKGSNIDLREEDLDPFNQLPAKSKMNYPFEESNFREESPSDLNYTQYTANSALSDSFDLETKAQGTLDYNSSLIEAISAFVRKDVQSLIQSYRNALDILEGQPRPNFCSLISCRCNLGIAHFYNSQHDVAINYINEALEVFKNFREDREYYDFDKQLLLLKCWCNLMVIKMTIGDESGYKEIMFDLIQYLKKLTGEKLRVGVKMCLYMLFRVNNFDDFSAKNIFNSSQDVEEINEGCYFMISGILLEIVSKFYLLKKKVANQENEIMSCYKKAFDLFQQSQDDIFMLLDSRLILSYLDENQIKTNAKEYNQFHKTYNILIHHPGIKNLNLAALFENFDRRMAMAKHVAKNLEKLENRENQNRDHIFNSRLDQMRQDKTEMWKQAVKLNLLKSINSSKLLLKHQKNLNSKQKNSLQKGTEQLSIVLSMMEKENNPLIIEKMAKDPYTRQSVNLLRSSVKKISSCVSKIAFREAFKVMNWRKLKPVAFKNRFDELEKNSQIIAKALNTIRNGDFLDKFHYTTRGHHKQYFQLIDDTLRWTSKQKNIGKIRACHTYHLSEIKGLIYGKATKTFFKKKNRDKEPWLCFSIILKNRPFDLYCNEENIDQWVIGLSHVIKKYNPDAYVLRPGQYYWRKLKYVMVELVKMKLPPGTLKKLNRQLSFIKAINIYGKLRIYANIGN